MPTATSLLNLLNITGPIYVLVLLGWACVRVGLFRKADIHALGRFVLFVALPALLCNALAHKPLSAIFNGAYVLLYASTALITLALAWWLCRKLLAQSTNDTGVSVMGMVSPNSGFVGFPVMSLSLPAVAGQALALNMLVENLLVLPLLALLLQRAQAKASQLATPSAWVALQQNLQLWLKSPMVLGLGAGAVLSLLQFQAGVTLPAVMNRSLNLLALASAGVSLFVIGGNLASVSWAGLARRVAPIALIKLVLHPLIMTVVLWVGLNGFLLLGLQVGEVAGTALPLSRDMQHALLLTCAMPIMGVYPLLAQKYGSAQLASAAMLVTTVGSFFTLNALLWVLG